MPCVTEDVSHYWDILEQVISKLSIAICWVVYFHLSFWNMNKRFCRNSECEMLSPPSPPPQNST